MIIDHYLIVQILLVLNIIFFLIGFCLGKNTSSQTILEAQKHRSFFETQKNNTEKLSIDDKKYVVPIVSNFEKKYADLGDIKTTEDNINSSVSKLKNMKS